MNPKPRPWQALPIPNEVRSVPAMLSDEERRYLIWLTSTVFTGHGAVVELGPWLGGSSSALAEGLRQAGRPDAVHSFDLFAWRQDMELAAPLDLRDGESFEPLFRRHVAPWGDRVVATRADLLSYAWSGGPIEILFVDAAKSWALLGAILRHFGPHLVPGRSRVVWQDFRHWSTYWLPLLTDSRPDLWQEVESVAEGTTVTFSIRRPLQGPGGLQGDDADDCFPLARAEPLLRARMAHDGAGQQGNYLRGLYHKCMVEDAPEACARVRAELFACPDPPRPEEIDYLNDLAPAITAGWQAFNQRDWPAARRAAERCLLRGRTAGALALLGLTLLEQGEVAAAAACLDEVVALRPWSLISRLHRARARLAEKHYEQAEADALSVLAAPAPVESIIRHALEVLGEVWTRAGAIAHGTAALERLGTALGHSPAYWFTLARGQRVLGRRPDAVASLRKALALAPSHARANELAERWELEDRPTGR